MQIIKEKEKEKQNYSIIKGKRTSLVVSTDNRKLFLKIYTLLKDNYNRFKR